jgi:hypothetical protein
METMPEYNLIESLLTEVIIAWLENATPRQIALDNRRLHLLMEWREIILEGDIPVSEHTRDFYTGVFLRDEFSHH